MNLKPLSFKAWLKDWYAIDYDRWAPEMTEATHKIWHEGYGWYLKEWKDNEKLKGCDKCGK